ncbi:MAG: VOC family protein [Acidiferrobacteraceae bacterium]
MHDDPLSEIDATFVVFDAEGMATPVKVTPGSWDELTDRFGDFSGKILVSSFHFEQDWPTWECHPHGDEWICLLSGDFDLVMDLPDRRRAVRLHKPGAFVIVPRGVWHTAKIRVPSSALFVTPGQGTLQRPATRHEAPQLAAAEAANVTPPALPTLRLNQVNLVCHDVDASLAFYRALGIEIVEAPHGSDGIRHARARFPDGFLLEFDNELLARVYNAAWRHDKGSRQDCSRIVIGITLPTREAVDQCYAALTAAGYAGRQCPFDAFWGQRYAVVADPDGHDVGLMSPADEARRTWPPAASPTS